MLYQDGSPVSLTPKEVETLVALVERRGQVVSKAELMDRLWPGTAVEESNLSQNLYTLRKTLGKREDGLPMIETFRKRGYRFNGEAQPPEKIGLLVATHTRTVTETESSDDSLPESASRSPSRRIVAGAFAVALILAVVYAGIRWNRSESAIANAKQPEGVASVKMTRLTPDIYIGDIELSPDGRYLAFGRNEEPRSALFLKDLTSGSVWQIMPPVDGGYGDLSFSPDGTQIYFTRFLKTAPNGTYFRVPFSGGEPLEVARGAVSRLTFSPDGSRIAFLSLGQSEAANLVVANADGSDLRILSAGDGKTFWYTAWGSNLSWSPDGRGIAVCGGVVVNGRGQHKVLDVSVADGSWRPIQSPEWNYIEDVAWLADRSGLVVLARETEAAPFQVWRVSYPDGVTRRLTNDLIEYDDLTISADSSVLIVRQDMGNMHLWLEPFDASDEARQLTFGTAAFDGYYGIDFLADGRIVYTSPRDGNVDLWIVDPATGKQDQLTRNAGDYNARPFVTPDGRSIVFVSSRGGSRQVWRMDSDGGNPMRLTGADSADSPVLSPDGRSVYFVQSGDDGSCLARIDIGGGEVECLLKTDSNFFPFSFSPDGKLMTLGTYDAASVQPYKLGIVSVENLSPQGTLPDRLFTPFDWTPDSTSVLAVTAEDRANLSAIPINGAKPIRLTNFSTGRIHAFAVSQDHRRVVLSRGNPSAEAVRLEGF